ncbi:CRE-INS-10 protein [Caenorhabditis remanei]|uniref:CRE-INS-10 protein n=2 Tax=Caenorhabditis remanei TaxID=31234 RepID=E3LIK7_CAERE|nr:CRE-INS-10 protein [Caenorhabditis remanei]
MSISTLQKTFVFISLLLCLIMVSEAAFPAEICIKKLERMCRIMSAEQCANANKISELSALADCCTGTCSFEEIKLACCSLL